MASLFLLAALVATVAALAGLVVVLVLTWIR